MFRFRRRGNLMKRREFLVKSMQMTLTGVAAAISVGSLVACAAEHTLPYGGNGANGELGGTCEGSPLTHYTNPGHAHSTVNLSPEQLAAAQPGQYELLGGRTHSHFFELTAADFERLASGLAVRKTDLEGDGHIIEIGCTA